MAAQASFRIVPGLPAYGPMATSFPPAWARTRQEGLVIEFFPDDAKRWVANFRPGPGGHTCAVQYPDRLRVLAVSSGAAWLVDPVAHSAEELSVNVDGLWQAEGSDDLILSRDGLAFLRIGSNGVQWHTRRLSWDGFSDVRVTRDEIRGRACYPQDDEPVGFSVDVRTGRSSGGSYDQSDSMRWERLAE